MARRTKQEAQATRSRILDAAACLFEQQGVSRTSLQAIAAEAGITRGAIYWHFKDKADLFNAMMERIQWPIERENLGAEPASSDPLASLHAILMQSLQVIVEDQQVQRLLGICSYQTEYTEEMAAVKERMLQAHDAYYFRNLMAFSDPRVQPLLRPGVTPELVALTMQHAIIGLLDRWLLTPAVFDLLATAAAAMDLILAGAGLPPQAQRPGAPCAAQAAHAARTAQKL